MYRCYLIIISEQLSRDLGEK